MDTSGAGVSVGAVVALVENLLNFGLDLFHICLM
jgi:hypothetical protein